MNWHDCKRWTSWWEGTCPFAPLAWHVADFYSGGLASEGRDFIRENITDALGPEPEGLRYRVPTKEREQEFARAAVQAAAAPAADKAKGNKGRQPAVGDEEGEPWRPSVKTTVTVGDGTKVLLALALSAVLAKGVATLRGLGLPVTSPVVGRLEQRVSTLFGTQLSSRGTGRGGQGFRVNWAAELRRLLGRSGSNSTSTGGGSTGFSAM